MDPLGLTHYGALCAWALARAHARTGDPVVIGAYLGAGRAFDDALARFAAAYADQAERDHAVLLEAIADGRVPAEDEARGSTFRTFCYRPARWTVSCSF